MIHWRLRKTLHAATGPLLLDVDASLTAGQFGTLFGPSGAGKTSILRMLAGLLKPDEGYIAVAGERWLDTEHGIYVKPQHRKIGYVSQQAALFPHLTVRENLRYALPQKQDAPLINELIEMTALGDLQHRRPTTLSGGQQQRVALARALVRKPALLLLDEPFSSLDHDMRLRLQDYVQQVHQQYGLTTLLVTHEVNEVFRLADHVFRLADGRITQAGPPQQVLANTTAGHTYQLTGEVVTVVPHPAGYTVSVQVGSQVITLQANADTTWQVGDQAHVTVQALQTLLRKLS